MVSNSVKISKLDTYNANHFKRLKGTVHPKIKDVYFSLFVLLIHLNSFGASCAVFCEYALQRCMPSPEYD